MHKTIENMKPTIPFRTPMRALRVMAVAACLWAGACLPLPAQTHAVIPTADQVGAACMPDTLAPIRAPFEMPQLTRPVFPDHTRMLTAQELEQMKSVDIGAVSPESLPDVSGMTFDNALSRKERVTRFLQVAKNPYCFSIGGIGVKMEFTENGPSLQDILTDFLIRQKSGL